jgi:class 3 adenylate cyclase
MQTADAQPVVTIVASDLQGSTALGERLDAEALREVLASYFDASTAVIEAHGGFVHKIVGDAIIAVFGLPITADDDAMRAVRAAAASQAALSELNDELERRWHIRLVNRTGVATGPVGVSTTSIGEIILSGGVVGLASALEHAAPPSGVLLAESTHRLVADSVTAPTTTITAGGGRPDLTAYRLEAVAPSDRAAAATIGQAMRRRETRKTVTIVFADLSATTLDGIPFAPDAARPAVAQAFDAARQALTRHGGTVEKFIGDAIMAVFGLPVRHEDDAQRAVRAALDLRTGLAALAAPLEADGIRMAVAIGVNSGEVVAGDASAGQRLVTGDAVNTAARLEQAAGPGVILLGATTRALVGDLAEVDEVAPLTLKGKAEPVRAFRLLGMGAGAPADSPRGAMVGREQELRWLLEAFETAVAEHSSQMVTLVGDAGVGKSRLTQEFLATVVDRARLVRGRCLPYGDGITYWPIIEVMSAAARIKEADTPAVARRKLRRSLGDEEVADRIAAAIGLLEAPFQVAELAWGIRRGFEILAAERPLVVVFDDIHWAEATFLELIDRLTATIESASVTLLCTARRELLTKEPTWAEGHGQRRIDLAPLDDADAATVIDNLLGSAGLSMPVRARVVAAAEGNPLFVEQLVSMLVDSGVLRLVDGRWEATGSIDAMAIPPTIHALLAARLDQLPETERAVIDPAAVIGLVFEQAAVEAIADDDVGASVPAGLTALEARQLVRRQGVDGADAAYRFGHLMIRDATYAGLLKRTRAELHQRFVAWIDETYRAHDRAMEVEEITGYHLEQAHRYLAELGPLDAEGHALGLDASVRLASAGERAFARGDMPATANLLRRAAAVAAWPGALGDG